MPIWFYNRPPGHADPTERHVADFLNHLDDEWRVCWGYYYKDPRTGITREGDFVVQGPKGQMLVMEVKGGQNRQCLLTGRWEGSEDGDNPLEQLHAEWKAILDRVHAAAGDDGAPWVGKALCMPHLNRRGIERLAAQFAETDLVTGEELRNFSGWWREHVEKPHPNRCAKPGRVFQQAVVPHQKPATLDIFLKETESLFNRYKSSESTILDMLAENPQWIVQGGPGTGKTFLALQRAQQLAESGPHGQRVLFLCFNLILAGRIAQLVEDLQLARGAIVAKSWEVFVTDILAAEGIPLEIPDTPQERATYFLEEVPGLVCAIIDEGKLAPAYDALVIDEAQDHDTAFVVDQPDHPLGWWSWYFALLREGTSAPLAIFLDKAQRPAFRLAERFSLELIRERLPAATNVRLKRVLRYTRQLHAYLAGLPFPVAAEFASLALPDESLPEGPEVEELTCPPEKLAATIGKVVRAWTSGPNRCCRVDDIVVMGFHRSLATSKALAGVTDIAGYPLADYIPDGPRGQLRYIGIHRAKGLDFLGVILIDLPLPAVLAAHEQSERQETFFFGATRARQLLAVVGNE